MVRDYVPGLPSGEEFNAFLDDFQSETDRAAAVLGAAFADDFLKGLLLASFVDDSATVRNLLDYPGPLSSFGARIAVAYAVGLINEPESRDLDLLRKIRNDFAHRVQGVSFATASVADRVRTFRCVAECFEKNPGLRDRFPQAPRKLFNLATTLLSATLADRASKVQRFQQPRGSLFGDAT